MTFICTAVFDTDVATLTAVERDQPELLEPIGRAAEGRMIGHTRYEREGFVMDLDEFASEEDYNDFIAEAAPFIALYAAAANATATDTVWKRVDE